MNSTSESEFVSALSPETDRRQAGDVSPVSSSYKGGDRDNRRAERTEKEPATVALESNCPRCGRVMLLPLPADIEPADAQRLARLIFCAQCTPEPGHGWQLTEDLTGAADTMTTKTKTTPRGFVTAAAQLHGDAQALRAMLVEMAGAVGSEADADLQLLADLAGMDEACGESSLCWPSRATGARRMARREAAMNTPRCLLNLARYR